MHLLGLTIPTVTASTTVGIKLTKTMQNGKTASYTYNGDGLRMSKTVDGKTTKHIWDGTGVSRRCDRRNCNEVYSSSQQLISSKNGSNENFYTYNGHGDVVQLTNNTGAITKQYNYDAFGVETNKTNNEYEPIADIVVSIMISKPTVLVYLAGQRHITDQPQDDL